MTKKYRLKNSLLLLFISILVYSCDPVYIPDPIDPRLPKYTEKGNDVAGAFINDTLWRSEFYGSFFGLGSGSDVPRIFYSPTFDSMVIRFEGETEATYQYRSISFSLQGYGIKSKSEMIKLDEKKITLDGIENAAWLEPLRDNNCTSRGIGQLYLRSVKYDPSDDFVTISGTFGFNYDDPACGKIAVTYGRFDFSIYAFYQM